MNKISGSLISITPIKSHRNWLLGCIWLAAFACAVANVLPVLVLGLLSFFAVAAYLYQKRLREKASYELGLLWWIVVIVGLAIGLYRPAGFNYPVLFSVDALHQGGEPFTQYLNIGKLLAGVLVVLYFLPIAINKNKIVTAPSHQLVLVVAMAFSILALAIGLLKLEFYAKPWQYILIFGLANLFATCLAEEAFMRLIFQGEIIRLTQRYTDSAWIYEGVPLLLTTFLFVVTHFTPTLEITLLYALAGFCYGLMYTLTKSLVLAVGLHFSVNIVHFSFLTYPLSI